MEGQGKIKKEARNSKEVEGYKVEVEVEDTRLNVTTRSDEKVSRSRRDD